MQNRLLLSGMASLLLLSPCAGYAAGCATSTTFNTNGSSTAVFNTNTATNLDPCNVLMGYLGGALDTAPGTSNSVAALPIQGVTGGVALPVSAAALPLPTGAATSANQTGAQVAQGGATSAPNAEQIAGVYNSTLPTPSSGQGAALQMDSNARLLVSPNTLTAAQATATSGLSGSLVLDRAENAEPTPVTNGQTAVPAVDLVGRTITSPYANKENWITGTASATGTSATTIIASAGGSLKNYITSVQCGRTDAGTTAITITFNDSASTVVILPNAGNGGATNIPFPVPLATAAATAFQFTAGTGVTTLYCSAQGFKGT